MYGQNRQPIAQPLILYALQLLKNNWFARKDKAEKLLSG
jgi:hypothetical protein